MIQSPRVALHSSATVEWYTPRWLIESAKLVMGSIELDPASCEFANTWIRADRFMGINNDGLNQSWNLPATVWLNPPYGHNTKKWVKKWISEIFGQGMLLVNNTPDRGWFKPLWNCYLCFFYKRIKYIDVNGVEQTSPTHGNVLVYQGSRIKTFIDVFGQYGRIIQPG